MKIFTHRVWFWAVFLLPLFFSNCSQSKKKQTNEPLKVVCTTGMIGDVTSNIAGNDFEVITLLKPGVDPHLFKPAYEDVQVLRSADIIFYNGLKLEGKLEEVFEAMEESSPDISIIAVGDSLPNEAIIRDETFANATDPHIWHSTSNWKVVTQNINNKLKQHLPAAAHNLDQRTADYIAQIDSVDQSIRTQLENSFGADLSQTYIVTTHDAFSYYAREYGFRIRTLLGISTQAEIGLRDLEDLISFIVDKKIKAVFFENSVSPRSINAVIEGCEEKGVLVKNGGQLFADALDEKENRGGTYLGMLQENTDRIVSAFK